MYCLPKSFNFTQHYFMGGSIANAVLTKCEGGRKNLVDLHEQARERLDQLEERLLEWRVVQPLAAAALRHELWPLHARRRHPAARPPRFVRRGGERRGAGRASRRAPTRPPKPR